jgi:uncharacterized protein (TIGR02466 family)
MIIESVFTQILAHDYIHNVNKNKIIEYCRSRTTLGKKRSNSGGFQSIDMRPGNETDKDMSDLISNVTDKINEVSLAIGIPDKVYVGNYWVNINYRNSSNQQHSHAGSLLSAVFYVKVPENSGDIFFRNPNVNLQTAYLNHWHLLEKIKNTTVTLGEIRIRPKENMLIIFPSWLEHFVESNNSDEERISIAFNTGLEK